MQLQIPEGTLTKLLPYATYFVKLSLFHHTLQTYLECMMEQSVQSFLLQKLQSATWATNMTVQLSRCGMQRQKLFIMSQKNRNNNSAQQRKTLSVPFLFCGCNETRNTSFQFIYLSFGVVTKIAQEPQKIQRCRKRTLCYEGREHALARSSIGSNPTTRGNKLTSFFTYFHKFFILL